MLQAGVCMYVRCVVFPPEKKYKPFCHKKFYLHSCSKPSHLQALFCTEDPVKPKAANQDSVRFRGNAATGSSQEGKDQLSHSSHAQSCSQKAPCK